MPKIEAKPKSKTRAVFVEFEPDARGRLDELAADDAARDSLAIPNLSRTLRLLVDAEHRRRKLGPKKS